MQCQPAHTEVLQGEPAGDADETDSGPRLAAFVHPGAGNGRSPFATSTDSISADRAVLRIPDVSRLDLRREVNDVSTLVVALDAAYGSRVAVEIRDEGEHVWIGSAHIRSVELIEGQPRQALLGVAFNKKLGPAEVLDLA